MRQFKIALASILGLAVLIFVAQNTEVVDIKFVVWNFSMSRVLLILLTLLVGFVIGYVVARLTGRKYSKRENGL